MKNEDYFFSFLRADLQDLHGTLRLCVRSLEQLVFPVLFPEFPDDQSRLLLPLLELVLQEVNLVRQLGLLVVEPRVGHHRLAKLLLNILQLVLQDDRERVSLDIGPI